MLRQRIRVRFRKEGSLRMISHRDLLCALERMFRRMGVKLSMSEGFHPRPRMSFPLSLAVGVRGLEEVFELELDDPGEADALLASFRAAAPEGLVFTSLEMKESGSPKLGVTAAEYEFDVPEGRVAGFAERVSDFLAAESYTVERDYRDQTVNVRASVETIELAPAEKSTAGELTAAESTTSGATLRMRLRTSNSVAAAKPHEVLAALGIADLLDTGSYLTRTRLALADDATP
jgi:radical SAM-linked protein